MRDKYLAPQARGIVKEVKVRTARGPPQEPASASVYWKEWGSECGMHVASNIMWSGFGAYALVGGSVTAVQA